MEVGWAHQKIGAHPNRKPSLINDQFFGSASARKEKKAEGPNPNSP
jgi:hypothetical protein